MQTAEIINYLKSVQAIAKVGLSYAEGPYDLERYEELSHLTNDMLARISGNTLEDIAKQFATLDSYPTPKVDVRGLVMKEDKVLLIQEKIDQKWAMPGGWCDIGLSPRENVEKEVREEAGLHVKATQLLAVWDKKFHQHPPDVNYVYKLNFLCETQSGDPNPGHEAMAAKYFDLDELPPLSLLRNTEAQIRQLIKLAQSVNGKIDFD